MDWLLLVLVRLHRRERVWVVWGVDGWRVL